MRIKAHQQLLQLPNFQLSGLQWNQGQEPLLLLHGMADHSLVWAKLGDYLQDSYHILAPDLRGHGNSSKPLSGYCCADIIADLEALIAHQGWVSAHVVAHSWSAKVAVVWAKQHPQAIRSLVLVDLFLSTPFLAG
jgi:pimeloyl-ACP methyl ester carboxylesterase